MKNRLPMVRVLTNHLIHIILTFGCANTAFAQDYTLQNIPVTQNSTPLQFPWAGGLNSPQLCGADLNNDGVEDIFVFDKVGQRKLAFIYEGPGGSLNYSFDLFYAENFPEIRGWVIMEDYNCDGIKDLFTYNNSGSIAVYKASYDVFNRIDFTPAFDALYFPSGPFNVNLYNSIVDRASIVDVNNDGDIDILSFDVDGTYIQYYENQRIEDGLPCDSMRYKIADRCWGNVFESGLSPLLTLRDTCTGKFLRVAGLLGEEKTQHVGSTLAVHDLDSDGDKDLLLGDITFSFINHLTNAGDSSYASFLSQDTLFPASKPLRLNSFPTASFLDADYDGRTDIVFTPFASTFMDNVKNVHLYTGSAGGWQFETDSLLVGDMIDAGEGAAPAFYDLDTDGRMDILIGNAGERITPPNGATETSDGIKPLLNTTLGGTSFSMQDNYIFTTLLTGLKELAPESGDIDGDSDPDLLVGESTGRIYWLERTCAGSSTSCFTNRGPLKNHLAADIDVGLNAVPALADLDRDNKPDLVIGERNGNLNYYKNVSSGGNLSFQPVTDSLGKIMIGAGGIGYSAPDVNDFDEDGKWDLLLGTISDNLLFFSNIEDNLAGTFSGSPFISEATGLRSVPNSMDINGDNKPEILVGNFNGGLQLYSKDLPTPVFENKSSSLHIYPNPANDMVYIQADDILQVSEIICIDILGRKQLLRSAQTGTNSLRISLKDLAAGMYVLQLITGKGFSSIPLIVK